MVDLTTTNVLLGIMAVVSVLEAIALIVAGVMGMRMYRQLSEQIQAVEARHLTPLTNRMLPLVDEARGVRTAIETFLTDQPNGTRHTNGTHAPQTAASGVTAAEAARAASAGPRSHVVYPDGPPYPGTNIPPDRTP